MYDVVKAFNSATQRFKEGAEVTAEHDLAPHSADSLVKAGYLRARKAASPPLPSSEPKA